MVAVAAPIAQPHYRTDASSLEKERERAADIVMQLADLNGLRHLPRTRGRVLMYLATDEGREVARQLVLERFGYVSAYPHAFVKMYASSQQAPTWAGELCPSSEL